MRTILRLLNSTRMLAFCSLVLLNSCASSEQNKVDAQNHPQDIIGFKPILKSVMGNCFKSFESL